VAVISSPFSVPLLTELSQDELFNSVDLFPLMGSLRFALAESLPSTEFLSFDILVVAFSSDSSLTGLTGII